MCQRLRSCVSFPSAVVCIFLQSIITTGGVNRVNISTLFPSSPFSCVAAVPSNTRTNWTKPLASMSRSICSRWIYALCLCLFLVMSGKKFFLPFWIFFFYFFPVHWWQPEDMYKNSACRLMGVLAWKKGGKSGCWVTGRSFPFWKTWAPFCLATTTRIFAKSVSRPWTLAWGR